MCTKVSECFFHLSTAIKIRSTEIGNKRGFHGLSTVPLRCERMKHLESMSVFRRDTKQGLEGKKQLLYKDGLFYSRGSPG